MIIPKSYGGLGFSAYAHSQVVTRLSTRSSALAVQLVPNSLEFSRAVDALRNFWNHHYLPTAC